VVENLVVHTSNHTKVICALLQEWECIAYLDSALPAFSKRVCASHELLLFDVGELQFDFVKLFRGRLAI